MSWGKISIVSEETKRGLICVDSYDDKLIRGRLSYSSLYREKHFYNLINLLDLIEDAIRAIEFPDVYTQFKDFSKSPKIDIPQTPGIPKNEGDIDCGKLATFRVKVIFRQNASWQGVITWIEGQREESFRSVYELIKLMDSALQNPIGE